MLQILLLASVNLFLESAVSSDFLSVSSRREAGYSKNLPAMLCFYKPARIMTALIDNSVTIHRKGESPESVGSVF